MSNLVIQTNVLALNSHRNLKVIGNLQQNASEKLSSGYRVNRAADDAAGLAISEKMRAQIRGLDQASRNSQDGISMIQTAEGGLTQIDEMLQRIRELVVQAANDTNMDEDRLKLQEEIAQLAMEIAESAGRIEFNKKTLFNGSLSAGGASAITLSITVNYGVSNGGTVTVGSVSRGTVTGVNGVYFQVGANSGQMIHVTKPFELNLFSVAQILQRYVRVDSISAAWGASNITATNPLAGGSPNDVDVIDKAKAISAMISVVDSQLTKVVQTRAQLGAVQNRLEYTIKALDINSENLSASESRIRDTDMGKEMIRLTKSNILQQAGVSMLAQANQNPQSVLQLLR